MTITLTGMAQFRVDAILLATGTRSKVERSVARELRAKVFPVLSRSTAALPGRADSFNILILRSLPPVTADLTHPEMELLAKALAAFEANEAGPGISVEDGEWFDPLLDSLQSALKEKGLAPKSS
jgi:hypothetical protein